MKTLLAAAGAEVLLYTVCRRATNKDQPYEVIRGDLILLIDRHENPHSAG